MLSSLFRRRLSDIYFDKHDGSVLANRFPDERDITFTESYKKERVANMTLPRPLASTYARLHSSSMNASLFPERKGHSFVHSKSIRRFYTSKEIILVTKSSSSPSWLLMDAADDVAKRRKGVTSPSKFHLQSASRQTSFDVHRTISHKYQQTSRARVVSFFCCSLSPVPFPVSSSLSRGKSHEEMHEPREHQRGAQGVRWTIRGCAGASVSTRIALRATPSWFSTSFTASSAN